MGEQMARFDEYKAMSCSQKSKVRSYRSRFRKRGMSDFDAHEEAMNLVGGFPSGESETLLFPDEKATPSRYLLQYSETPVAQALFWLKPVFLIVASICCTFFLVWCTAGVLGGGISAWVKASLLEVGVVALFCCGGPSLLFRWVARSVGLCGVVISLLLLHGGVVADYESRFGGAHQRERLLESRDHLVSLVASLPRNHVSKREQVLQRVSVVDEKLAALATVSVAEVETLKISESSLRLFIVFFNLFCTSLLARLGLVGRLSGKKEVIAHA